MRKEKRILLGIWISALFALSLVAQPRFDFGTEVFDSDDVVLWQADGRWSWEANEQELSGEVSFASNHFTMDYEPVAFDFRGISKRLSANSEALQSNVRWRVREDFEWIGNAGAYQGFTNFRSVWLAEYFEQQFEPIGQTALDRWEQPDPSGINGGVGARWEYVPGTAFLEVVATGLRDEVAPGYEIDFEGLRQSRVKLNGFGITASTENVLSARVRSRVEVTGTRVSEREVRWGANAALNVAVGETGVLRLRAGASQEDPQFEAWFGEATWDWAFSDSWAVFAQGRYYEDNGEIENALLFTSAAPGLTSSQWNLGVRWRGESSVLRLQVGRLQSNYEPTNPSTDFFQNLYSDRNWNIFQLSFSRSL